MTPEEAKNFYEDDEDAEALFAKFDAAPKGVTVKPEKLTPATQEQSANYISFAGVGLYADLHRGLLPASSVARSNTQQAVQG